MGGDERNILPSGKSLVTFPLAETKEKASKKVSIPNICCNPGAVTRLYLFVVHIAKKCCYQSPHVGVCVCGEYAFFVLNRGTFYAGLVL